MRCEEEAIKEWVRELAADPAYQGHPLLAALQELTGCYYRLNRKLNKIARISDRMQIQLKELNQALQVASFTDPLTGAHNRRFMMECLKAESNRAERRQRPFAVIMADVDHFKAINDDYGHDVGDLVLIEIARILRENLREYDICARWGGEEFLILLPETDPAMAVPTAEKLRLAVAGNAVLHGDTRLSVTMSLGVGIYRPGDGDSVDDCIRRADQALFGAKRIGRNHCCTEGSDI